MFPTLPPLCLLRRHRPSPPAAMKLRIRKTPTPESDLGALSGWNSFSSAPNCPSTLFVCVPKSIRTPRNVTPEYCPLRYVDVDVKAGESSKRMSTRALLDMGGQGSFINDKLSTRYQLPRLVKPTPISLILANGSPSKGGNVTHFNPLILRIAGNEEAIGLDVAPTTHDIVLGIPWIEKHDPAIRYDRNTMTFNSPFCRANCTHFGKSVPLHKEPSPAEVGSWQLGAYQRDKGDGSMKVLPPRNQSEVSRPQVTRDIPFPNFVDETASSVPSMVVPTTPPSKAHKASPLPPPRKAKLNVHKRREPTSTPKSMPKSTPVFTKPPAVSIVGAHAFTHLCNQPGVELFTMSFAPACQELSNANAAPVSDANEELELSAIPPEYLEFRDLFSNAEAKKLPPHRPYDHTIELNNPGDIPPAGPVYPITSPLELETLREYCIENLSKGYIRHS